MAQVDIQHIRSDSDLLRRCCYGCEEREWCARSMKVIVKH